MNFIILFFTESSAKHGGDFVDTSKEVISPNKLLDDVSIEQTFFISNLMKLV